MRKIAVKILTILLVVSAAILVLSGCASLDVQLDRDGSGTATLTLSKEEGVTKESIESELNEIFEGAAKLSQGRDVLKLKSVKESADGFSVKISFRRIRYIEGIGQYNFMSFSDFIKEMNKTSLVSNWEKGKYKNIQNYNEFIYNFNNQADESRAFSPVTADGEKLTAKEFTAQDSPYAANDKGMIFTYYIVGFSNLESVTFRFNGKIGVVGGKNVELVGDNAVKVTPVQSVVNVTEIREGEDPVGVERSVDCFTGYVYFVESANLTLILCLSGAGLLLAALIAVGIWRGWFKKIWRGARCRFIRKNYGLYLMMLPALVMLIIFSYAPMTGIVLAFKDFSIDDGIFGSEWAGMLGFKNFYDVLTTPGTSFGMLARNTVILAGLKFIFGFLCAILLAILFSYLKNNWFKKSVQTISYFPYFLSWVVVSGIAYLFLAADGGILNQLIALFGGGDVTWSVLIIPALIAAEVIFFRKWCSHLCPISSFMSLIGRANRTFQPAINDEQCLETAHGATCGRCAVVCEVGINPRHPELGTTFNECTRCRACADVCPGHAISFPLIARKTAGAPALESTPAGASGAPTIGSDLDLDEPSEALS